MNKIKASGKNAISILRPYNAMLFAIIGSISTVICSSVTICKGLEFIFVLPVSLVVSRLLFQRAYSYWKDNLAFSIIFASIYARYLVTPTLMSLSKSCLSTVNPSVFNYRFALFIQVFELFATLFVIDTLWTKYKNKRALELNTITERRVVKAADFKLSIYGFLFIIALITLVILRGNLSNVLSHMSTWWYISKATSDLFFYDLMAIEIVKSVISISIISVFARAYHKSKSKFLRGIFFFLAFIVGLTATMFYEYTARTSLAQLILSNMIMLVAFFPRKRKFLLLTFGIGGTAFVLYTFATGSMNYEIGGSNDNLNGIMAKMGELYVSGPSMIAITQERYEYVRTNMSLSTYFSDIINTTHIFGLFPFLRNINNLVAGIPTTNQLFVNSLGGLTYILPNYSLWTYYTTPVFGWIMEIVWIIVNIKLICFVDSKRTKNNDAFYFYAITYVDILLGQAIFINNSFLFWHVFTSMPFWLLLFSFINRLNRNKVSIHNIQIINSQD